MSLTPHQLSQLMDRRTARMFKIIKDAEVMILRKCYCVEFARSSSPELWTTFLINWNVTVGVEPTTKIMDHEWLEQFVLRFRQKNK